MILITGASGFLGSFIANTAKANGLAVRGLIRATSERARLRLSAGELTVGDMTDGPSLDRAAEGADAVIHCAATTSTGVPDLQKSRAVTVGGLALLLDACKKAGVPRFIQISSQSADPRNASVYGRTKFEADEILRASPLEWTILKPALIYGPGPAGVFSKVVEFTQKFPVVPVLGNGRQAQCPVHVGDVAAAALECLKRPDTIHRQYDIGGPRSMEFNEMLRLIMAAKDKQKTLVHLPLPVCMMLAKTMGMVLKNPPVTVDHVLGVKLDAKVDIEPARRDLGFAPRSFEEGLKESLG